MKTQPDLQTRRCCRSAFTGAMGALLVSAGPPADKAADEEKADQPITVVGSRLEREEIRERAVTFVRQIGVARGETPAARWIDAVCPRVIGIPSTYSRRVETKFRDIAERAGVEVAKAPCQTNIAIAFTADGGDLVRKIALRSPGRLAEVPVTQRTALLRSEAPIRWWYGTEVRERDGSPAAAIAPPWTSGNAQGGGSVLPMNSDTTSLVHYNSSIISTQFARAITSATVVIDVNAAEGAPLDAVAAYAALVALAEIRAGSPPAGSILSLFDGGMEKDVSDWDMGFLKALYSMPLDRAARRHRGRLVNELVAAERSDRGQMPPRPAD